MEKSRKRAGKRGYRAGERGRKAVEKNLPYPNSGLECNHNMSLV